MTEIRIYKSLILCDHVARSLKLFPNEFVCECDVLELFSNSYGGHVGIRIEQYMYDEIQIRRRRNA